MLKNFLRYSYKFPALFPHKTFRISSLKDNIFTISLIGKPNVGKSSIFNKLSGGMNAITDSLPGLTRDRNEIITKIWGGVPIRLVDTAGWETIEKTANLEHEIKRKMIEQTQQALIYCDLGSSQDFYLKFQ